MGDGLHRLDESDRQRLSQFVKRHGAAGAARHLGLTRGVVVAAAAGGGIRKGSFELVREALRRQTE